MERRHGTVLTDVSRKSWTRTRTALNLRKANASRGVPYGQLLAQLNLRHKSMASRRERLWSLMAMPETFSFVTDGTSNRRARRGRPRGHFHINRKGKHSVLRSIRDQRKLTPQVVDRRCWCRDSSTSRLKTAIFLVSDRAEFAADN